MSLCIDIFLTFSKGEQAYTRVFHFKLDVGLVKTDRISLFGVIFIENCSPVVYGLIDSIETDNSELFEIFSATRCAFNRIIIFSERSTFF